MEDPTSRVNPNSRMDHDRRAPLWVKVFGATMFIVVLLLLLLLLSGGHGGHGGHGPQRHGVARDSDTGIPTALDR